MPMSIVPMKVTCQSCGWSRIAPHQGDVVFVNKQCECCGSEQLIQSKVEALDMLNPVTFILDILKK